MNLAPDITETLARARADLRMGLPVVLTTGDRGLLLAAAETLSPARFTAFQNGGVVVITARRATTLRARVYDGDIARLRIPDDAGIDWVQAVADPSTDLATPMKGPFSSARDGGGDLYRLGITLLKSARLLPAAVAIDLEDANAVAMAHNLTLIDAHAVNILHQTSPLHAIISARLPIEVSEKTRLHVFRPDDGGEEHYAIEIGRPRRDTPVLTRLHSACFTGDLMGSLKCDCGPQLRAALAQMGAEGAGVLLYLNQEGRGIGLANKMRAYSLQDQGFDTVEANHRLGFEDDERDFRIGASILTDMGFGAVRLMTNNPNKIDMMRRSGVEVVERVPLKVGETRFNSDYLATKAAKSGHLL